MPRPARTRNPATYEDLIRVPDRLVAELLDGELFATPRPGAPHAHAALRLGGALAGPFDEGRGGPGGWILLHGPELHVHDEVVVPDLAGWRRTRLPSVPDTPFLTLPPDWICEILSPSTERVDRVQKLAIYAREGVGHAWLLNPLERTLEVLRLDGGQWILVTTYSDDEGPVRLEPFDAISIELSILFHS